MKRKGQSLAEVLVGMGLGALFIIGAVAAIAPALQTSKDTAQIQAKAQLGNELSSNVRAWAAGNWTGVLGLATGTSNTYYLNTATSSFTVTSGTQSIAVGSSTYIRSFYLSDVYRDTNGNVTTTVSGNYYDPSTKQVTVAVASTTYVFYLTRNTNNALNQISWVGGSGQAGPITIVGTSYYAGTSITVNTTGSVILASGGGACTL